MEVKSLYREPERREQIAFGALEFHDVFRIFRSGPAETVALRGLDLRIEPRELVALFGPSGLGQEHGAPSGGRRSTSRRPARCASSAARSSRLDEAELARLPRARRSRSCSRAATSGPS